MAAEDYFDIDGGCPFGGSDDPDSYPRRKRQPKDFPCRNCHFSKNFKCTRVKGVQKCPHADWFAEHNGKEK